MIKGNVYVTFNQEGFLLKKIEYYSTTADRIPFFEWIDDLDQNARLKIYAYIDRVALGGSLANVKPVGGGVFEIKINYGPGYRIYFGNKGDKIILLLLGGDKGTQSKDIRMAKKYWRNVHEST